jgi:hypothetical protein
MNEMNREYFFDIVAVLTAGATQKDAISDFFSPFPAFTPVGGQSVLFVGKRGSIFQLK